MNYQVIIPAAGRGTRMKADKNKLLLLLKGRPIIIHTLEVFEKDPNCQGIVLVVQPEEVNLFSELICNHQITKAQQLVHGGSERQQSVYNGLKEAKEADIILVHDGARPFITLPIINRLVKTAAKEGAAIVAVPVKDTVKRVEEGLVAETVERSSLWSIQTPQAFRMPLILQAHAQAQADKYIGTDESSLAERAHIQVRIVEGDYDNIKLTTPEDLVFAEAIIQKRKSL